jgi:hypothetical protein
VALAAAIGNRAATQVARAESGAGGAGPAPAALEDHGADGGPGVPGFDAAGATDEERIAEIRTPARHPRPGDGDLEPRSPTLPRPPTPTPTCGARA